MLEEVDASPKRSLGQNFVADPNTVRRIATLAAVGPGDHVVEIGAGLGSLTLALLETGCRVTAIEIDGALVTVLRRLVEPLGVHVVHADAMSLEWDEIVAPDESATVVANLPYNVATPLLADLLDDVPQLTRFLVMVQREVGERLAARPGDAAYGLPSLKVSYWAHAEVVGKVPATVFVPQPKVESALVSITRRPEPAVDADPDVLFRLARAGFGQRRKMLRRALAGERTAEQIAAAGVRPEARAEELTLEEWAALARSG
ncbi:MAG: 16S rRNA (adenine(1518)-N(6)/adenine(1519)-N(6))-dimethyltransferase RsmA [Acidimicrobiales bacterium]|nr:16S rRNA (adenine(1518)-N(6)/adenine(1519)-N(6))-dimethyltransferase RsmA [Acidimicrobiales bacterium]